jgi:hypothetical protein
MFGKFQCENICLTKIQLTNVSMYILKVEDMFSIGFNVLCSLMDNKISKINGNGAKENVTLFFRKVNFIHKLISITTVVF